MRPVTGKINRRAESLKSTTVRDFKGGWNVIDSELALSSDYAVVLRNMYRAPDGSLRVRYGTRLFANIAEQLSTADIVNAEYYDGFIVAVGANGMIAAVDGTGLAARIWDSTIAAILPSRPAGWGSTDYVCFTRFKTDLLIGNGIDKPLLVNTALHVDYLQDLATLTNGNTPIGRYVCTHNQYVVWAGIPGRESTLSISNKGTSGTYLGDSAPNDAVEINLSTYVSKGSPVIKGISSFRDKLVVKFEKNVVIVVLGEYSDSNHVPRVEDVIVEHGSISHRAVQNLGDDLLFADIVGVPSIQRAVFTETIQPKRPSQLIDPEIQKDLARLSVASLEDRVHSIYNRLDGQYMLFIPNTNQAVDTLVTRGFVYTLIDALKVKAWSEFTEWNWRSACRSQEERVFFTKGSSIYLLGNDNDPIHADRVGDEETFSDDTCFTDQTGFSPVADEDDSGVPIIFDWELPWADFDRRTKIKIMKYMAFDVEGDGRFTAELYVDNLYADRSDLGEEFTDGTLYTDDFGHDRWRDEPVRTPEVSMEFVGNDALGYGSMYGSHYGGGRNTIEELLWTMPCKGKIIKSRLHGETTKKLRFISKSFMYLEGDIRR